MKQIFKILRLTAALKPYYILITILTVIVSLLSIPAPLIVGKLTDILATQWRSGSMGITKQITTLLIFILLIELGQALIRNIQGYLGDMMSEKMTTELWKRFYRHLTNLSVEFFDNKKSGELVAQMERGNISIISFIHMLSNNFLSMMLSLVIGLGVISYYAWPVAVTLLLLLPIYTYITKKSSIAFQAKEHQKNKINDTVWARIVESIAQIKVVKVFLKENYEYTNGSKARAKIEAIENKKSIEWHFYDFLRTGLVGISIAGIIAYIVYKTTKSELTIGEMTVLFALVNQVRFPLFTASFLIENGQRAITGSTDYFKVLETVSDVKDKKDAKELSIDGLAEVTFKDVVFAYSNGDKVLDGVSFKFEAGKKTAIVGESGQGKTTITNLITRFYDVNSGSILINNQNILDLSQSSLRENISVVFQEPSLFSGTIFDNILYGLSDKALDKLSQSEKKELVEKAAESADADKFISKLEKGYQTLVGERGVKLSGGQKQRIAIARAFIKDSSILILDEATSALDTRAEIEVQKALDRLMKGRTTIIIAHRLSTIAGVDNIVTIKDSKLEEYGTPQALAKSGGTYSKLLALQEQRHKFAELESELKEFVVVGE